MILTAEADIPPTDSRKLLYGYGFAGCHPSRSIDLSVHARIHSSRYIRLSWEPDVDNRNGHAAIIEVKFGKKTKRTTEAPRERSAEQLVNDVESDELVVESSDLGTSEDCFEPTASCINDT